MDTEINETIETSISEPMWKSPQLHCALSNKPECPPECLFQCATKGELDEHIERLHRMNTQLPCSVCMVYFRDLDALAKHMSMAHKNENHNLKCSICEEHFNGELFEHIQQNHMEFNHIETEIKCNECSLYFLGKDELQNI